VWQPRNSPYSWGHYLRGTAQPGHPDVPLYAAPGRHHRRCRRSATGIRHLLSSGPHSRRRTALGADPDPGRRAHRPAPLCGGPPRDALRFSWHDDRRPNDHRPPRGNPTPPGQSATVRAWAMSPSSKGCTDHDHLQSQPASGTPGLVAIDTLDTQPRGDHQHRGCGGGRAEPRSHALRCAVITPLHHRAWPCPDQDDERQPHP
jgi:hypothetical protein